MSGISYSEIPLFNSIEGSIVRPVIILPYPNNNDNQWPENKILFYKSSGLSNDIFDKTGNTWVPFYGIINDGNKDYFKEKGIKKADPETGKDTNQDYPDGYFIKLSMIYQIKNKEWRTYPELDIIYVNIQRFYFLVLVLEICLLAAAAFNKRSNCAGVKSL